MRRGSERMTRDGEDWRSMECCWINPVKHGLVGRVCDWRHSSFHRDVRRKVVPEDWAGEVCEGDFGE